ncbi:MAG TPA: zinc ribbon domain-containing protein [Blastocatellia bacterium]|nr:zinc ribbon domain-containing protein [Blastocatellia bacterium]
MFCPSCGSNNAAEVKYCTRCGTNLAAVNEALTGKPSNPPGVDQRMVKLLKDYYQGQRFSLMGVVSLLVGAVLLLTFAPRFPDDINAISILSFGLMVYGASVGIWGVSRWFESASEGKALGYVMSRGELARPGQDRLGAQPVAVSVEAAKAYSTDPIAPASVTEETTRQLDERAHASPPDSSSERA